MSDPVGGNPTQYMIEKALAHHQLDWRYLTVEVAAENLGDAIRGIRAMGFSGGHIGSPHKQAVIPLLDRCTETAEMVGAVNLISREGDALIGENTEGKGLLQSLCRVADPPGIRAVLLGAGRIARSVAVELAAAGVAQVIVVNRTRERAGDLAALLTGKFEVSAVPVLWQGEYEVPAEADLLINATSIGREDPDARAPIAAESLRPGLIVADVTTDPPQTWLLREAAVRGCTTLDGLAMYIDQVAVALKIWTGVDPDCDVMREAIEEFLEL
ncbi:MAG: shikimate dehydrogenase [Pirellulales bacterium]|nr:shikimate dehydrogenase [Pirellulales bacterium]